MQDSEIRKIIEALLFASPGPLTQSKVNGIFKKCAGEEKGKEKTFP